MEEKNLKWRVRFIAYAPFVLWIGVIFFLSSGAGSMEETSRIIRPLLEFLFPSFSEESITNIHGWIRKSAHFTEYSILAFLAFRAFRGTAIGFIREHRYFLSIIAVLLVASIDEFNQSFETTRTGAFRDVLLDLSGGIVTATVLWLFYRTRKPVAD